MNAVYAATERVIVSNRDIPGGKEDRKLLGCSIYQVFALALMLLPKPLMIAVLVILGFIAVGLGTGFMVTARAPFGYEDEQGFHLGRQEGAAQEEFPYSVPEPKLV